jgi:hypothetical protein
MWMRLLGASLSLPFQLLITSIRLASEAATEMVDRVAVEMECQAHHEDIRRPAAGYPASLVTKTVRGNSLYLSFVP